MCVLTAFAREEVGACGGMIGATGRRWQSRNLVQADGGVRGRRFERRRLLMIHTRGEECALWIVSDLPFQGGGGRPDA